MKHHRGAAAQRLREQSPQVADDAAIENVIRTPVRRRDVAIAALGIAHHLGYNTGGGTRGR